MIYEIFYAFLIKIIKLFHRNFIATFFMAILIILVRRKYKLSDIKKELYSIWNNIKKNHQYRNECCLIVWLVFMLFCTVFTRDFINPFENILGNWLPYNIEFSYVELDCIENVCLFIPYGYFINSLRTKNIKGNIIIVLLTSLCTECFQIITVSGTFQLSDIFYNIIGGMFGILISKGNYHSK
ncbi:VanZ family protein [Clostridium sp. AF17-2]|jgi:glycopeptide antibiotics resistance protein|uniref:VanZ family protein n=1 Tax=Clostridium sp. AF17-21AC TaxID=2293001 RepID=UPI000E52C7C8|nr:VanZ family protein [Clostridium sp. AF17-21AC]RGG76789.1 VanZ family protein [Clostridium sp. AF17-21AC]RHR56792.1 VanZ family protein [Clostridium sp. AF17-2]